MKIPNRSGELAFAADIGPAENVRTTVPTKAVLEEAREGDTTQSSLRMGALAELTTLRLNPPARSLAEALMSTGVLPANAGLDALHLALATVYRADYLLTKPGVGVKP